jgi:hypothetical protein
MTKLTLAQTTLLVYKLTKYICLSTLLVFTACLSDDDTPITSNPDTAHIKEVAVFGCTDYVVTDLSANMFTFEDFAKLNDLYLFDTKDKLIVRSGAPTGSTVLEENMHVNKFLKNGTTLLICAAEGIFEMGEDGNLQTLTTQSCTDMVLATDGSILLTTDGLNAKAIHKLEGDQTIPLYVLSASVVAPDCADLIDIVLIDAQNIFAVSCDQSLVHFKEGVHVATFGTADYELPSQPTKEGFYALPYQQDLIIVAKNGQSFLKVMKYTAAGEWIELKLITSGNANSQAYVDLLVPDVNDAVIWKDKLYLAATFSSCPGFIEFDITKNQELLKGEYYLIRDPGMPSLCIDKMIVHSDTSVFVITSEDHLTEMSCE